MIFYEAANIEPKQRAQNPLLAAVSFKKKQL